MNCRHCDFPLEQTFLDLGFSPPSNAYLTESDLTKPEKYYPLKIKVCTNCWLVQTEDYVPADELFNLDYAYFSSASIGWLKHTANFSEKIIQLLNLGKDSLVIEVASNDGYLLKNFLNRKIPCLGIEPTDSTASVAENLGIPVMREFFGEKLGIKLASMEKKADLIVGNNVYAHVPDINDFTRGLKSVLKPNGTITLEFPHLMQLIGKVQFDTVYHEHFSYLSLISVTNIFNEAGIRVYDCEELSTHGGSLRIFGCHSDDPRPTSSNVYNMINKEISFGLMNISLYNGFQEKADKIKDDFKTFLEYQKKLGKLIIGYGAAAKGNTLLNYAGIKGDIINFVCDIAPSKQGKYLPGSHIPILNPFKIEEYHPDWVIIFPWNIADEVIQQQQSIKKWGGKFVTAIPELRVLE